MKPVKIKHVETILPAYTKTTDEILLDMDHHLQGQPERFRRKILRIFKYAGVDRRYSIMPPDEVLGNLSFEEKNNRYIHAAVEISSILLATALANTELDSKQIDAIITVSCTGFMIPSLDAYLINALDMRSDILRLPVTEMGCAAGVSALMYAQKFLQAWPNKRIAIVAFESPMSTFQQSDFSMTNMVCAALFSDGAACAILSSHEDDDDGPEILDGSMYHFHDEIHMMGYALKNSGFHMILDPSVPAKIEKHFDSIITPFLHGNNLDIHNIDHFIFHPGGKKIIQLVEGIIHAFGKNIDATKSVLQSYGNMSSATVLFVLKEILNQKPKKGDKGLMLSFGPGFSAQRILLSW